MNEQKKTKQELIIDLDKLRKKVSRLKRSEVESRNKEKTLREAEALYAALFQNNPIQTVVVDLNGRIIAYNRQKKKSGDRLPQIGDIMYKDYAAKHKTDMHSELIKCMETSKMREYPELKYGEKVLNIKIAPFKNGAIITSIDITERKKHEQELLRIRKAVESTSEAIVIFDSLGNIFHNRAFHNMFEFTREQLTASGGLPALYKESNISQDIFRTIMEGKSWTGVVDMIARSGRELIVRLRADAIKDDHGEIIGFIALHSDITEQIRFEKESKNLQAQVQHAQKLESLGILAGGIAHDFNNLLLGILGNADLALLEVQHDSSAANNIMDIITIARRAAELCRQILAYSGKGKFVIEPLNLSNLVIEIGHLIEVSISKTAVLKYDLAENIPLFDADATQIRQVIMNLITNASEAIGEKSGIITIKTGSIDCDREYLRNIYFKDPFAEGVYVFLEVSDTGCGMDEKTKENMFDPFFTTKISGRGLGLAAVMGIIRAHNAACKVTSEPGHGTTFKILFPVADIQASEMQRPGDDKITEQWIAGGKVFLIDKDETAATVTRKMLEEIGFEVLTGKAVDDVSEIIDKYPCDLKLLLIDMDSFQINNREIRKYIKNLSKDIPVIFINGYKIHEDIKKFTKFAEYIQKPYDLKSLKGKIIEVFGNKTG